MAKVKQLKSNNVYQLKITLNYTKPAIWRKFIVESDIKLSDLHRIIQTVMGWYNSHLNHFRINNEFYSMLDDEMELEYIDYRKIKLNQVILKEKQKFYYEYDFGDGWEHTIILEKILPKDSNMKYPVCIDGKRRCPPEDCGGVGGYEDLLEIIKDPKNDGYDEMMDWLGDEFNPEEFEIDIINEMLKEKDYGCLSF